jgi:hypothetical protein
VNRRQFVTSLGAAAVPVSAALAAPADQASSRARVSLNGTWERHVNGVQVDRVEVPSSLRPSGFYRLDRTFLLPRLTANQRAFVHFEAVNYHGRVWVNGKEIGETLLFVPAEFDITTHAKEGVNTIAVDIADLCPEPSGAGADEVWLGVNPGWEGYGGIIRDAWIEVRPVTFLDNGRFAYRLSPDYHTATCRVTAWVSALGAVPARCEVSLLRGASQVGHAAIDARCSAGSTEVELEFTVDHPALWSPDDPNLYTLRATLVSNSSRDEWNCRTGFRDITVEGRAFKLNGELLLLNGICRHDMWKGQGFTLTRPQMEQDMRAIKELGVNYIRLVHYPHDRYIIQLADELGLLVSEEPGYWNVDFRKITKQRAEIGIRIMESVARRDWNSPSIFAWLLANESHVTADYLRKGKQMLLSLDPQKHLVSMANSMSKEEAKPLCEETGMDFFDDHPYTFDVGEFDKIAEFYGPGKPLLFTEWGGKEIGQSEIIMPNTVDKLLDLTERGQLAGHCFWSWQDLPQFSRIDPEMREGILESGVVTEGREPRSFVYLQLARLFEDRREKDSLFVDAAATSAPVVLPLRHVPWPAGESVRSLDLSSMVSGDRGTRAWKDLEARIAEHWKSLNLHQWERTGKRFALWSQPEVEILGSRFTTPVVDGFARPIVLTPDFPDVEIPVHRICSRLHFLGHVTCPGGFPLSGTAGDTVATYQIRYQNGQTHDLPLRAGIEVAAANAIHEATRIDPVATSAQRAFWYIKDWAREHYQALLFSLPVEKNAIESIRCHLHAEQPPLLLFAVSTESES